MRELGVDDAELYELDHRMPLYAGGHPTDPRNLRSQPKAGTWPAKFKGQLESSVCQQLCHGDTSLQDTQAILSQPDWTIEYEYQ